MDVHAIRDLISQAKEFESEGEYLRKQIYDQMESLHHTIELPEENACDTVFNFVVEYIDHVPVFIDGLYQASGEAGIQGFISPFLDIAEENFLSPLSREKEPREKEPRKKEPRKKEPREEEPVGLDALLDKAYFTHRLIEEVNDAYIAKTGTALIPINMTWSNLIIHSILGEPFANELDTIIEQTVQQMMRSQSIYNKDLFDGFVRMRCPEEWINLWSQWSCLSKKLDIELKFTA